MKERKNSGGVQTLRIGVCSCATHYYGKVTGQKIITEHTSPSGQKIKRIFQLEEVVIPEGYEGHRGMLRQARCHFFLDVHHDGRKFDTSVDQVYLLPNTRGRAEQLFISPIFGRPGPKRRITWESWKTKTLPRVPRIARTVTRLLNSMTEEKLRAWLDRMTPSKWMFDAEWERRKIRARLTVGKVIRQQFRKLYNERRNKPVDEVDKIMLEYVILDDLLKSTASRLPHKEPS